MKRELAVFVSGARRRKHKRIFYRPAKAQAMLHALEGNVEFGAPVGEAHGPAVTGDHDVSAGVTHLLVARRPPAVSRCVRAIVINALNGMPRGRAWTHVGEEHSEIVPPRIDGYAASAVAGEGGVARVIASVPKMQPRGIFRRRLTATHCTMGADGVTSKDGVPAAGFIGGAAAGRRVSRSEIGCADARGAATGTGAVPVNPPPSVFGAGDNGQSTKDGPREVLKGGHKVAPYIDPNNVIQGDG